MSEFRFSRAKGGWQRKLVADNIATVGPTEEAVHIEVG